MSASPFLTMVADGAFPNQFTTRKFETANASFVRILSLDASIPKTKKSPALLSGLALIDKSFSILCGDRTVTFGEGGKLRL
jgi:hypothetical protein